MTRAALQEVSLVAKENVRCARNDDTQPTSLADSTEPCFSGNSS